MLKNRKRGRYMNLNYAIFRSEPILTINDLAQIGSHNKREKKAYNSNPDIDIERSKDNIELVPLSDKYVKGFYNVVKDYKKEHSTSYYANALYITPDHLNRTFKSKTGTTAKDYIQSRIITEAKRLLYFSDLANKEIAYELGFNEPGNFSAFFKKHTQLSPSNFKKNEIHQ